MIRPRHPSFLGIALLALAGGFPETPEDLAEIRRGRLARFRAQLLREGLSEAEAEEEEAQADRAAMDIAKGSLPDWGWAFDIVLKERREARASWERVSQISSDMEAKSPRPGATIILSRLPDPERATVEEIAAAADPPGSLTATTDGRLVGRGVVEAIDLRATIGMVEVNRRRREAGELGTRRQRKSRRKGA